LFAFFCRNSINLSVNKRLRWDLPETDPIRSENWMGTEKRARSIFCLGRLRSWRKSKPHSKWQIQRQFTLVRQLLEVDFGRVLRQKVKILGKTYAELCGSSSDCLLFDEKRARFNGFHELQEFAECTG